MGFNTKAIHAGQDPDPQTGSVTVPIIQTSTFAQQGIGIHKGWDYSRAGNPTRDAAEANLAALENATHGHLFSSGMAAIHALTVLLKTGDHIVCTRDVYGGTWRLITQILEPWGLKCDFVESHTVENVEKAIRPETKLLFVETPTNPLLTVTDIARMAELARRHKLILVVDNTFMSPFFQNPLDLGAHIVMHSCTKYILGHSDMIAGFLATRDDALSERLRYMQKCTGALPSPQDCFLILRSTKTLGVRMERHYSNAMKVALMLSEHAKVGRVHYPGLPSHPQYELASRQMRGFGGMVSFELADRTAAERFATSVRLFTLAESLGGVESLVNHPAGMTHASVPKEQREAYGLTDSLLRLSVGIEDIDDLLEDLEQALAQV